MCVGRRHLDDHVHVEEPVSREKRAVAEDQVCCQEQLRHLHEVREGGAEKSRRFAGEMPADFGLSLLRCGPFPVIIGR